MKDTKIALYVHIPFCVKKCLYCDFLSMTASDLTQKSYVEHLLTEIDIYKNKNLTVTSIFFGGGTPSCINENDLIQILCKLKQSFHVTNQTEITIEVNPGTTDNTKLLAYFDAGINRISFGLQSTIEEELKQLGRIHDYKTFLTNYEDARIIGFRNINIDLMSAIPGQTESSWETTLYNITELNPEHISAYSLIIEEGTPFYDKYGPSAGKTVTEKSGSNEQLPDEETERRIYQMTRNILGSKGYHQYEISNYAREKYECIHNLNYWSRGEYLGFGIGASSFYHGCRYKNVSTLEQYGQYYKDEETIEVSSVTDAMEETMFLGLRMNQGVSEEKFEKSFCRTIEDVYPGVTDRMIAEGLMKRENGWLSLTDKGRDLEDYVTTDYMIMR